MCSREKKRGREFEWGCASLCLRWLRPRQAQLSSATLRKQADLCALCAEPQSRQEAITEVSSPERDEAAGRLGPVVHSVRAPNFSHPSLVPQTSPLSSVFLEPLSALARMLPPLQLSQEANLVFFPKTTRAGGHSPHSSGLQPEDQRLARSSHLALM